MTSVTWGEYRATGDRWSGGEQPDYELNPGRWVYDEPSITGLNRVPVVVISGYSLAGAKVTGNPPQAIETINEALLVDGSLIWIEGVAQTGVLEAGPQRIVLKEQNPNPYNMDMDRATEWKLTAGGWMRTIYVHWGKVDQKVIDTTGPHDPALIRYYYNPADPRGILAPAQVTYRRLEEISRQLRRVQSGPATKTLVSGHVRNISQAKSELESDEPLAFIPGDVKVDRAGDTAATQQLISEFDKLQPLYYQLTHTVDTTSPVQRPSGTDRQLVLGPMLRYVDTLRIRLNEALAIWGCSATFEDLEPEPPSPIPGAIKQGNQTDESDERSQDD